MHANSKAAFFDRLAAHILVVVLGLAPVFFVPFLGFGVEIGKTYFIALGAILAFVAWIIARMIQGSVSLPKTPLITIGLLVPVTFLVSAFFSPAWRVSLSGLFAGPATVMGMTILALVFVGSALYINSERKVMLLTKLVYITTGIIAFFEIIYLVFGPKFLSLGTFFSVFSNMVGKWNDLGLWFGLIVITTMLGFQFMSLTKVTKIIAGVIGFVSLVFLVLVNFKLIWAVLGFIALLIFVYSIMVLRNAGDEAPVYRFPAIPFAVLVLSLFFFLASPLIGTFLSQKVGLGQTEIRPSVQTTGHVIWQTIKQDPILGVGPDRFANAWNMNQPKSIILTPFWNTQFNAGSGFIPTIFVTTGLLGGLTMLAFLVLFLIAGVYQIFRGGADRKTHLYLVSSFLIALYSWIIAVLYTPGVLSLTFAFATTGIFVGILSGSGRIPARQAQFLKDPRLSFFGILFLVLFLLGSLYTIFTGTEKFVSMALYTRAQVRVAKEDLVGASDLLAKAIALYPSDTYHRANTNLAFNALSRLLNNDSLSKDIIKSEFQKYFTTGETSARQALVFDGTNYINWTNLATLYQNVLPLQIAGAYDNAKAAYDQASKLAPNNPELYLMKARLEMANGNSEAAETIIKDALLKKPNYINAIFFLAELEAAGGDIAKAITQLEKVASADPRNASVFLELGLFKYEAADYQGAVSALERSITLDPTVLNTHYLLGLSYYKVGRTDDAKQVFASVARALPDNATIAKIVANLNAGRDPLDGLGQGTPDPIPESSDTTTTSTKPKTN